MKVGITGRNGFIGSHISKLFSKSDTVFSYPRPDLDILFYFGSPSSNIIFDQNIDYCFGETINGFLSMIQFCRRYNIKLIYPSSATVYTKNTAYARCKAILEEIHMAYGGDVLGLRIFTGYGVGEENKGDYASVVHQFCKLMMAGKRPVIFGDGKQSRDFIYIDDIINFISDNLYRTGIVDVGTGVSTTFNELVEMINKEIGSVIRPVYAKKPKEYISETICEHPCRYKTSLAKGIHNVCVSLYE